MAVVSRRISGQVQTPVNSVLAEKRKQPAHKTESASI
jgi:hypothetical protein